MRYCVDLLHRLDSLCQWPIGRYVDGMERKLRKEEIRVSEDMVEEEREWVGINCMKRSALTELTTAKSIHIDQHD